MRTIVALGAYSGIVEATLRCFAKDGDSFFLVGKDGNKLQIVADDLKARGATEVKCLTTDLATSDSHERVFAEATTVFPSIDILYLGYGVLSEDPKSIQANYTSAMYHVLRWADYFVARAGGTIAVIGSVAGDRGRASNFVYGSAKGALGIFLEGLRAKLFSKGVRVVTIKPGFVDTPMTKHLKQGPLFAKTDSVGCAIYKAILSGKGTVYVPWFWEIIMTVIRLIPSPIFRRLPL